MKTNPRPSRRSATAKLRGLAAVLLSLPLALQAQTVILFEGFEAAFPGYNGWTVGDANPASPYAYWDDVDLNFGGEGARSGNWKGYCAGYGFGGSSSSPTYQNDMNAFMEKAIDLTMFTAATLRFWHKLPGLESCCDSARVYVGTNLVWSDSNTNAAWTATTIDLSAQVGGLHMLRFEFASDGSVTHEGWYLDDIQVTGYLPPVNDQCSGAIPLTSGVPWTMDTGGAGAAGDPLPSCRANFGRGVWFKDAAPANGTLTISTCGSGFDTVLEVWEGACGSLLAVPNGCNDDDGPACSGRPASVVVSATAGGIYHILVGGYAGAGGTLQLMARLTERLVIRRNVNGTFALEWVLSGTLQAAPSVTGPWQDVTGATSPYVFTPTADAQFFRTRQ